MSERAAPIPYDSSPEAEETGPRVLDMPLTDATPMMAQYLEIKRAYRDALLFYRMGDFYELFFDDAAKAAETLDIALTKRGKHQGEDIPMCGVPVHSHESYLERLIRAGFKVAVCEQVEDPAEAKKRGAKSVVARQVVRLVTPGTLTEDSLLDARSHNYLAALARTGSDMAYGLAWADVSSGEFEVMALSPSAISAELARLEPGELLVSDSFFKDENLKPLLHQLGRAVTALPGSRFDSAHAELRLKSHWNVGALDGFGNFSRAELGAMGALLDYIELTQVGKSPRLQPPRRMAAQDAMIIDQATRANLEIMRTLRGETRGSLFATIDRTVTGAGARELGARLAAPLTDPARINARLDAVEWLLEARSLREDIRASLRAAPDMARALSRLSLGRGGPRDLANIRSGLAAAYDLARRLDQIEPQLLPLPEEIQRAGEALRDKASALQAKLAAALAEDLPLLARDGGFITEGFRADLDEQLALRDASRKLIAGLQNKYADETGINVLKIRHNNVLGYYIEVPPKHGERLTAKPLSDNYIHRQTMANAMRFTTAELAGLASRIAEAAGRALEIELALFDELAGDVLAEADVIARAASALASLDAYAALAELAAERHYARPRVDASLAFRIKAGRHPVVEAALEAAAAEGAGAFIPNDCDLTADAQGKRLWLLTGPNMAGKSTFLRQNALIALLAQMGSFVPAEEAHIGVLDRLFSRVGAADDLARGRSTFMVEMVETAAILNQAGPRSLVILDEIGRGTATFDGLSIAWACVEHLHEVNLSRALFATHYHELTVLAQKLAAVANATMRVKEWQGDVVFLHEVAPGAADRSYGIQVAKLAGLPASVTSRAQDVLSLLEKGSEARPATTLIDDLPLFSARAPAAAPVSKEPNPAETLLASINPDELTPRDALDLLYRLKSLSQKADS